MRYPENVVEQIIERHYTWVPRSVIVVHQLSQTHLRLRHHHATLFLVTSICQQSELIIYQKTYSEVVTKCRFYVATKDLFLKNGVFFKKTKMKPRAFSCIPKLISCPWKVRSSTHQCTCLKSGAMCSAIYNLCEDATCNNLL